MPFKPIFEKHVNDDLRAGDAGPSHRPASPTPSSISTSAETDIKKPLPSPSLYEEATDLDLSTKPSKTKDLPPRFSTLFSPAPKPATPQSPIECCRRSSKKGVHLSTPVFVLLVVVLLFESALLFGYTVVGLYLNLPGGLRGVVGLGGGCECEGRGAINFAPNFVFGGGGEGVAGLGALTMLGSTATIEAETTTSETSTTTSSPATTTTSSSSSLPSATAISTSSSSSTPKSTSISIVTKTPGVVQSTIVVTSSAGGDDKSETESSARSTVTSVQIVDGPATTIQAR